GRPVAGAGPSARASRGRDRGGPGGFRARTRAARRRRAYARRIQGGRRARRPAPCHARRGSEAAVTLPAMVLLGGLLLAAMSAAVGVAAAAVSQLELTRWVSYKLRGAGGAAGAVENPGRVLATANALTTIGTICAAAAIPALLARTTPTVLGIVTLAVGVPLLVTAAYLVPRGVARRGGRPCVHAVGLQSLPRVPHVARRGGRSDACVRPAADRGRCARAGPPHAGRARHDSCGGSHAGNAAGPGSPRRGARRIR